MSNRCHSYIAKQITTILVAISCVITLQGQLAATDVDIISAFGTNNVATAGQFAYATAGDQGGVIVDLQLLAVARTISPPAGTSSIDDVSIDGDLLFVLDASRAGALSVYSIANPTQPTLVSGPVAVDVGPFAGVSAASGCVVVSGGTGQLSALNYSSTGILADSIATIDLGVGQPDVLIDDDGQTAYVSTDFAGNFDGETFGITVIDLSKLPVSISIIDRIGIDGAGFSPGSGFPANFPIESALQGDTLYVASGDGVCVFDVSNPSSVQTITSIPLPTNPVNVDVLNDQLFVVGNSPTPTMTVIDISDLTSPVVQTTALPTASVPLGVAVTSDSVVIADDELGVLVETLFVLGDIDGNGMVDFLDIGPFITILGGNAGFNLAADINGDGNVNFLDISGFIGLLSRGGPS